MFKSKRLTSKPKQPKFKPGDQVMFVEKPDNEMNELVGALAKAIDKAGHKDVSKKIKKVQDSGVTCYTSVVFIAQGGEEPLMYGVWGPNGIVRKPEEELSPLNY